MAERLFGAADLNHVGECAVGREYFAIVVGDDEGIRCLLKHAQHGVCLGRAAAGRNGLRIAGDTDQEQFAGLFMHHRDRQRQSAARGCCGPRDGLIGLAAGAHGVEQLADCAARVGVDAVEQALAQQLAHAFAQRLRGRGIGFDDFEAAAVEHQHTLAGQVEQNAIARFEVAQSQIVALHGLLRIDQLLLEFGLRAQVASERNHPTFGADMDSAKRERHIGAAGRRDIHLSPHRARIAGCLANQLGDLRAAFDGDRVFPGLAYPAVLAACHGQRAMTGGHVLHHAIAVNDQHHIRRG